MRQALLHMLFCVVVGADTCLNYGASCILDAGVTLDGHRIVVCSETQRENVTSVANVNRVFHAPVPEGTVRERVLTN